MKEVEGEGEDMVEGVRSKEMHKNRQGQNLLRKIGASTQNIAKIQKDVYTIINKCKFVEKQ